MSEYTFVCVCTNLQYHPDRLGGDCSSEAESGVKKFLEVDAAWRVLSDQTTRTQYDLQRRGGTLNCASFTLFTDKVRDGFLWREKMFCITYVDVVLFFTDQDWHKNVKMHIFSLHLVLLFDGKTQFSYVFFALFCFFLKKCKTLILKIQTFFPGFRPNFPNSIIFFKIWTWMFSMNAVYQRNATAHQTLLITWVYLPAAEYSECTVHQNLL